ncbi:MAG: hypothetical protein U5L72_11680 [Bacteroidales bacterium]|nr:hypothetical protein [Bacteroidales bacterium]
MLDIFSPRQEKNDHPRKTGGGFFIDPKRQQLAVESERAIKKETLSETKRAFFSFSRPHGSPPQSAAFAAIFSFSFSRPT